MLTFAPLKARYDELRSSEPRIRIRDAAKKLHVSELELVELNLGGDVVRLSGDWKELIKRLHQLDRVMALTRNEFVVHERKGVYSNISFFKDGEMGVAVNEDIDLRFFMKQWKYAYAVRMVKPKSVLHSFQFFNAYGEAVHKVYLTPKSNPIAFHQLLESHRAANQKRLVKPKQEKTLKKASSKLSNPRSRQFQLDWLQLKDTHDFYPLLKQYKLGRLQALQLAPNGYAWRIQNSAIPEMFKTVSAADIPIMVFVGNAGCLQIHTGTIQKIVELEHWFNVMDPLFNLHLNMHGVSEAWIVKKPTADGVVTSLEVFGIEGSIIMQCFGKRKPGLPELKEWRNVVEKLSPLAEES